jgi:hypothetical protein
VRLAALNYGEIGLVPLPPGKNEHINETAAENVASLGLTPGLLALEILFEGNRTQAVRVVVTLRGTLRRALGDCTSCPET